MLINRIWWDTIPYPKYDTHPEKPWFKKVGGGTIYLEPWSMALLNHSQGDGSIFINRIKETWQPRCSSGHISDPVKAELKMDCPPGNAKDRGLSTLYDGGFLAETYTCYIILSYYWTSSGGAPTVFSLSCQVPEEYQPLRTSFFGWFQPPEKC